MSRTFAGLLQDLLEAKGWTPYRLSQESGVPRSNLSAYLAGESFPENKTLGKLAEALEADLDEMKTLAGLSRIGPDWPEKVRRYAADVLFVMPDSLVVAEVKTEFDRKKAAAEAALRSVQPAPKPTGKPNAPPKPHMGRAAASNHGIDNEQ